MNDSATISRTAHIVDALAQADRIEQLIREARAVEPHDRPSASQLLDEAIAATRELPDLHELHAVGAFPTPAEFAEQLASAGSAEERERIAADLHLPQEWRARGSVLGSTRYPRRGAGMTDLFCAGTAALSLRECGGPIFARVRGGGVGVVDLLRGCDGMEA